MLPLPLQFLAAWLAVWFARAQVVTLHGLVRFHVLFPIDIASRTVEIAVDYSTSATEKRREGGDRVLVPDGVARAGRGSRAPFVLSLRGLPALGPEPLASCGKHAFPIVPPIYPTCARLSKRFFKARNRRSKR
jgi:hypothetical protein